MNKKIFTILQACSTLSSISEEFNKPFGWLKLSSKRQFRKILSEYKIEEKIDDLVNDRWTVEYLHSLQNVLFWYRPALTSYMQKNSPYISDFDIIKEYNPKIFLPMYFNDTERGTTITMEITSDIIKFVIMDNRTGNTFTAESEGFVQPSQAKIASVCKARLVEMLKLYYRDCIKIEKVTLKRVFSDIKNSINGGGSK